MSRSPHSPAGLTLAWKSRKTPRQRPRIEAAASPWQAFGPFLGQSRGGSRGSPTCCSGTSCAAFRDQWLCRAATARGTIFPREPKGRNPPRPRRGARADQSDPAGPGMNPAPDKGVTAMAYGHAERTLATIRLLEAETRELLSRQKHLEPEHAEWLRQATESASRRLHSGNAAGTLTAHDQAGVRLSRRVHPRPVRLGRCGPGRSRSAQPACPAAALPCSFLPVEPAPDPVPHRVPERVVKTLRAHRARRADRHGLGFPDLALLRCLTFRAEEQLRGRAPAGGHILPAHICPHPATRASALAAAVLTCSDR